MKPPAVRVQGFGTTVFSEFTALAQRHQAINLGQGFPDFDGPEEIKEVAIASIRDGQNQYAPGWGTLELRRAVAEHQARFYGLNIDADSMVVVTSGATEALFDAVLCLVDPGDEVVLFEPYYDSCVAAVEMAGGLCRYVVLRPPDAGHDDWWFDPAELEAVFGPKTKLVVVNTPHNPTGKVYTQEELEHIAALCRRFDAYVLSDEVYEHLVFAPHQHIPVASVSDLSKRTVTVGSAGKTFSFTGWKIGWAVAPPEIRDALWRVHQFVTFTTPAPLQAACARALCLSDAYFARLLGDYTQKRDLLVAGLTAARLPARPPRGTYFALASISHLGFPDDDAFCRHLTTKVGVAAIPPSAFYSIDHRHHGRGFARFAFCKRENVLRAAVERLTGVW